MLKIILLVYILFNLTNDLNACKADWDNTCQFDSDCCSTFCDNNNGQWVNGICRASSTKKTDLATQFNCKEDWYDKCARDSDCCSNNCENNNGKWTYGVCKPRKTTRKAHTTFKIVCKKDWDHSCAKNSDCCSNICDKHTDSKWDYGICQPKPKPTKLKPTTSFFTTNTLNPTSTTSTSNKIVIPIRYPNKILQACECVCKDGESESYGLCKFNNEVMKSNFIDENIIIESSTESTSTTTVTTTRLTTTQNVNCKKDWDNSCVNNSDCCSNYCETFNGIWKIGICKPNNNNNF